MTRPRRGLAGAAAVVVAALLTGCATTPAAGSSPAPAAASAPAAAAPVVLVAPAGFGVAAETSERPVAGPDGRPLVRWQADWVLSWAPVAGAEEYAVWFGTSEGRSGGEPQRVVAEPRLRLQAAAGSSAPERVPVERDAGLLFTSSQLLVAVAARAGGTTGPRSPWFPVGDVPESGVPVAAGEAGHHG